MRIIKIEAYENGGHANQSYHGIVPNGYALIPDNMTLENFPFGEVVTEEINGVMTVTGWTPGVIPEPEPEPEPEPTESEQLRADIDFLLVMGGYAE